MIALQHRKCQLVKFNEEFLILIVAQNNVNQMKSLNLKLKSLLRSNVIMKV
jgi:hypothetical protein